MRLAVLSLAPLGLLAACGSSDSEPDSIPTSYNCAADTRGETYTAILGHAGRDELVADGDMPQPRELLKYSMHSYGAQFCEVRVHAYTGEVRVERWLGSFDVGRIINPRTAHSQLRGGIIMGLGMALMEDTARDPRRTFRPAGPRG